MARQGSGCGHVQEVGVVSVRLGNLYMSCNFPKVDAACQECPVPLVQTQR